MKDTDKQGVESSGLPDKKVVDVQENGFFLSRNANEGDLQNLPSTLGKVLFILQGINFNSLSYDIKLSIYNAFLELNNAFLKINNITLNAFEEVKAVCNNRYNALHEIFYNFSNEVNPLDRMLIVIKGVFNKVKHSLLEFFDEDFISNAIAELKDKVEAFTGLVFVTLDNFLAEKLLTQEESEQQIDITTVDEEEEIDFRDIPSSYAKSTYDGSYASDSDSEKLCSDCFPNGRYDEACNSTVSSAKQHDGSYVSDSDSEKLCLDCFPKQQI
ncbi:hypothetical protein CAXC1_150059 [Candidatus Xenohaliotis californiensis]|uniref:Uncharacterized protein n=1 Tax=Candidatus Xenohaliotis californiensis TaxID=84677 RepID=A0ABP0ERY9_9RICK|nr:hypothetical protein CAXC1_150059 [Candidatus Xenohaliotis californiensis]